MSRGPRITAGRLRGRLLGPVPQGVRPTSSRVREALFSMLGADLTGKRVLDAFGGSGLLGLEAWSRGATVVIVERDRARARSIREAATRLCATVDVHVGDVLGAAAPSGMFDIVLADPPYSDPVLPVLDGLGPQCSDRLVLEADGRTSVPEGTGGLVLERSRRYGGTTLHLYVCESCVRTAVP